jgi:predicted small metal-binding protein
MRCGDVVDGCEFHVHSVDEGEVIRTVREYAKAQHAMAVDHDGAEKLVETDERRDSVGRRSAPTGVPGRQSSAGAGLAASLGSSGTVPSAFQPRWV